MAYLSRVFQVSATPLSILRYARLTAFVCVVVLMLQGITARPTGYLHSWNQVSALTVIRQLYKAPSSFLQPTGVVARVTTPVAPGVSIDERFLNFQEFPLYHAIAASVGKLGVSLEVAGRILSIFFFAFQWCALRRLMLKQEHPIERCLFDTIYLTSFALVYYGQAIMSDIAMSALGAWAIERAMKWRTVGGVSRLLGAVFCVGLSALFKSYGLIFAMPVAIVAWPGLRVWQARLGLLTAIALAALPVLSWHIFAIFQGGYNEVSSHSLVTKLNFLLNINLYKSFWRDYTHVVGLVPGVIGVAVLVWNCFGERKRVNVPPWIGAWLVAFVPYTLITLDKLVDHEYYLLPFAAPIVALTGILIAHGVSQLSYLLAQNNIYPNVWLGVLVMIFFGAQLTLTARSVRKAQRENPDVVICTEILRQATRPEDTVAFFSDTQRYNSLAYYSERRGFHVERWAFPAKRYIDEGARVFLLASDPTEQVEARKWLNRSQSERVKLVAGGVSGVDFRGKPRLCEVYRYVAEQ